MDINLPCVMYVVTLVMLLCERMQAYYWNNNDALGKRGGMRPYPFPCNGYDNLPRCLHGGKGPKRTSTKAGKFCVCLCRPKWIGPECAYASEGTLGKRSYDSLGDGRELLRMAKEQPKRRSWSLPWLRSREHVENVNDPRPFTWKYGLEQTWDRKNAPDYYDTQINNGYDLTYDSK